MANKIVAGREITGTERYPREMIKPTYNNINLSNNIYNNLVNIITHYILVNYMLHHQQLINCYPIWKIKN